MSNYRWQIYLSVCTSTSKTILQTNPLIDVQNLTMAVWTSHRSFSPTEPAQRAFYVWLLRSAIVRQIPLISFMGGYSCNAVSNVKTKYICSRPWIKKQQLTSKHAPDVALNNRTHCDTLGLRPSPRYLNITDRPIWNVGVAELFGPQNYKPFRLISWNFIQRLYHQNLINFEIIVQYRSNYYLFQTYCD